MTPCAPHGARSPRDRSRSSRRRRMPSRPRSVPQTCSRGCSERGRDAVADWAVELGQRVRQQFWVTGQDGGRYLAMAVDGSGGLVDGIGSNMGHVIGSGLLNPAESRRGRGRASAHPRCCARSACEPCPSSNPAYNPLGYHTGSIWTHDTAICASAWPGSGHAAEAPAWPRRSSTSPRRAATDGPSSTPAKPVHGRPAPYPASCRPQAWAAASAGPARLHRPRAARRRSPRRRSRSRPCPRARSVRSASRGSGWAGAGGGGRSTEPARVVTSTRSRPRGPRAGGRPGPSGPTLRRWRRCSGAARGASRRWRRPGRGGGERGDDEPHRVEPAEQRLGRQRS